MKYPACRGAPAPDMPDAAERAGPPKGTGTGQRSRTASSRHIVFGKRWAEPLRWLKVCAMPDQQQTGKEVAAPTATASGHGLSSHSVSEHGALRVSHEDRDQVAEALRVAAGDGRLTADELDERLERALTARTYDDLAVLLTDLPAAGTALAPVVGSTVPGAQLSGPLAAILAGGVAAAPAKELIKIHVGSARSERVGRWTVPARMDLKASSGHITIDFTEAVITQQTLHVDAEVKSGHITLVTKPGIVVDVDEVSVRNGYVKVRAPWGDSTPVFLRVTVAGTVGSGGILARPPRRSFWQWLRRAPWPYAIPA
jgi:uncharacterized protein DUF1707